MRNPNRLEPIYDEIHAIHKMYLPDWRIGQLMSNFFEYLRVSNRVDVFFMEDDTFLKEFKNYVASLKMCDLMCGSVEDEN